MSEGVWWLPEAALEERLGSLTEKEARRVQRFREPSEERRPSRQAVRMIASKVLRDSSLSADLRQLILALLRRYQEEWDKEYSSRKENNA
jgi:hypothetical protein